MILVNGARADHVPAVDRGLHYGDGLFETLAVADGTALALDRHLDRLARGCQRIGLPAPPAAALRQEVAELAKVAARAVVKIIVTRGQGGRGYGPPPTANPTRVLIRYPWPTYPDEHRDKGIELHLCETRLARNPALAGLKHLNRLEQVLGGQECAAAGCAEGLMRDTESNVVEGTMTNLFLRVGDKLLTPDLSACGVEGVMRGLVMEVASEGAVIEVQVCRIGLETVGGADEVFMCNSIAGIWPVNRLGDRAFAVGPVTRRLQSILEHMGVVARG